MFVVGLLAAAFIPMLVEDAISRRHERQLRAAGAVEPPGDVYRVMQVAYPGCFLAIAIEAFWRGSGMSSPVAVAGLAVFAAAKGLKYWAIASLGVRWTFRILVPPGSRRTLSGPYRFLKHPNYIAVAGELAGMALLAQAPVSGVLSVCGFSLLMLARVRVEEQALNSQIPTSNSQR